MMVCNVVYDVFKAIFEHPRLLIRPALRDSDRPALSGGGNGDKSGTKIVRRFAGEDLKGHPIPQSGIGARTSMNLDRRWPVRGRCALIPVWVLEQSSDRSPHALPPQCCG